MIRLFTVGLVVTISSWLLGCATAYALSCGPEAHFNLEQLKNSDQVTLHELDAKEIENVSRYLNVTEGAPPDLKSHARLKIYLVHQKGVHVLGGSPPSQGAIDFTEDGCAFFRLSGPTSQMIDIVTGNWSLNAH